MGTSSGTEARECVPNATSLHPKVRGDVAEAFVTARLLELGKTVLKPVGDNARYDLAVEEAGRFSRVQVKTAYRDTQAAGCRRFPTCSSLHHVGRGKRNYRGEADFFAVYFPENRRIYWVPVDQVGRNVASLRLEPTRNHQVKGVRLAVDFELGVPT